jgi:hypothetical protein
MRWGALATLHSIVRFAIRNGWILDEPVAKLEADERPHPIRRRSGCSTVRRSDACSLRALGATGR